MLHLIGTIKFATSITLIAAGSIGAGVLADILSKDTQVTLGDALGVTAVIVGGAWYIGQRLQKIEDAIKHESQLRDLQHKDNMERFNNRLDKSK